MLLNRGDRIGLVGNSDALPEERRGKFEELCEYLRSLELEPVVSGCIFERRRYFSGSGEERAQEMNRIFADESVRAVFDVTGGDLANGVLDYLDYKTIKKSAAVFFGYSDVCTVINSINKLVGRACGMYQIMNLVYGDTSEHRERFRRTFMEGDEGLFLLEPEFLRGSSMTGVAAGGNIRCTLKLAGTRYYPDYSGKLLILESLGCTGALVSTWCEQLRQLGAFEKANGILVGQFTVMEKSGESPCASDIILDASRASEIPVARTRFLGHSSSCRCVMLGKELSI